MSDYTLKMPDVGEGVVEAEIVEWKVKVGDVVEEDQDLVDVMTDKATVEIPAPVGGTITQITGEPGEVIAVGSPIVVIATDGAAPADAPAAPAPAQAEPAPSPNPSNGVSAPTPPSKPAGATSLAVAGPSTTLARAEPMAGPALAARERGKALASPAVRQRAREADVPLDAVPGTGPAGRVTHQDMDDFLASGGRLVARTGTGAGKVARTGTRETKVIGLRRKIAENMEKAWAIPHITYAEEIDVTAVEELRRHLNATRGADQAKLTMLPFLCLALVKALDEVPQANAHYDSEAGTLTEHEAVHIGIATATDKGLMVPVLRNAEAQDAWQIAGEVRRLADCCRDGTAARDELSGSTITITSLGAMGGVITTPIINPPETAIIGVNKILELPAFDDAGRVVPRLFMNLSSSFDHRIVDGYDAARLIQRLKDLLEQPATIFM